MTFEEAVAGTEELADAYRVGLGALRARDKKRITCNDPRDLGGSLDVDDALSPSRPNDPRWDYGIGTRKGRRRELVVWIEVHPASSRHVRDVLNKLSWLKSWLVASAPLLNKFRRKFVWVASGRVALPQNSPQRKKLAAQGLHFAGRRYRL